MDLIPLGIVWSGYLLVWYGGGLLKNKGIGFTDLILPSRVAKVEALLQSSSQQVPSIPPYVQGPGVQPGSSYYPTSPGGGLPSKPPIGGTPPAYYG